MVKLGFNNKDLKVDLIERTSFNDECRSFYYEIEGRFYILYVDHEDVEQREYESNPRYMLVGALNYGDDWDHEILPITCTDPLISTDCTSTVVNYINMTNGLKILS